MSLSCILGFWVCVRVRYKFRYRLERSVVRKGFLPPSGATILIVVELRHVMVEAQNCMRR